MNEMGLQKNILIDISRGIGLEQLLAKYRLSFDELKEIASRNGEFKNEMESRFHVDLTISKVEESRNDGKENEPSNGGKEKGNSKNGRKEKRNA